MARLRAYADAAEAQIPPTPASIPKRPLWRSPLAGLAAAAVLAVVVAGAVLLVGGNSGDGEVVTPAGDREPDVTSPADTDTDSAEAALSVPDPGDPCPGVPLAPGSSASADPGFPVGDVQAADFLPYVLRIQGTDRSKWVRLAIGESRFGEHLEAAIIRTVEVEMCEPFSRATATAPIEAQVLDLEVPTVRVYVMGVGESSTQALIVAAGSASVTVDQLIRALTTLRWEPETPSDLPFVPTYRQGSPEAPPLQAAHDSVAGGT